MFRRVSNKTDDEADLVVDNEQELADILIRNGMIPFDAMCVMAGDKLLYGYLGSGDLIGCWARYTGEPLKLEEQSQDEDEDEGEDEDQESEDDIEFDANGMIGVIVGDYHGRVVLDLDIGELFLGWLNPDEYELIFVHDGSRTRIPN